MSDSIFKSNLAGKINGFVSFKRNQGYKYDGQPLYILRKFDDFCLTHGNPYAFSKEIVTGFIFDFKENYNFKRCDFIGPIRQMGIYLNAIGDSQAYIPAKDFQVKDHAKDIYIMTDEEVAAFFHQLDLYFYENRNDGRVCHYGRELLYPAYFRLLHTTGCRTFEARWLKVSDVNLDLKYIDIMNSKGNRDRRLYIRGDLADYLKQYYERIKELFPDTEYFFPSINGTVSKYGSEYSDFLGKSGKGHPFTLKMQSSQLLIHCVTILQLPTSLDGLQTEKMFMPVCHI